MKRITLFAFALSLVFGVGSLMKGPVGAEEGKGLFEKKCGLCHPTSRATAKKKSIKEWKKTVMRMKNINRAPINEKEADLIINYLAENYGK